MSINSREELNNYYQYFNNLVDEYTEKWKIRPSNLKRYLQPGSERFNKFLEKSKSQVLQKWGVELNDSYGRLVLQNVLEDRYHMEKDGVLTFESHKMFESSDFKLKSMKECLYKGIDKANQKMEKILADVYDTNLSDIECEETDKHLFSVSEWKSKDKSVIVYSEEDIDIIKGNIIEHLWEELSSKEVSMSDSLSLKISEIVDRSKFENSVSSKLSDDFCIKLISDLTGFSYKCSSSGHYIWEN